MIHFRQALLTQQHVVSRNIFLMVSWSVVEICHGYPTVFFAAGKLLQRDILVEHVGVTWNLQVSFCDVTQLFGQERHQ